MARVARYTDFYDESIFDDDDADEKDEEESGFSGPMKLSDVPATQIRKMELLHTLMQQWGIENHNMVAFLMRFIFKSYRPGSPDEEDCKDAIKTLKGLCKQAEGEE